MGMPTRCSLHGHHRFRPSVERFGAEQQAAFQRFCGALLQSVLAKPTVSLPDTRLDREPASKDIIQ